MSIVAGIFALVILWHAGRAAIRLIRWAVNTPIARKGIERIPGYWTFRRWMYRPVWGYRRPQVILFGTVFALLSTHLVSYSQAFSPVPALRLKSINRALDRAAMSQDEALRLRWSDRRNPADGIPESYPFPTMTWTYDDPNFLRLRPSYLEKVANTGVPDQSAASQFRSLSCGEGPGDGHTCTFELRVPIGLSASAHFAAEGRNSFSWVSLNDATIKLRMRDGVLQAQWEPSATTRYSDLDDNAAFQLHLPGGGAALDAGEKWHPIDPEPLLAVARGERGLSIGVTTKPGPFLDKGEYHCERADQPSSTTASAIRQRRDREICDAVRSGTIAVKIHQCPRRKDDGAWLCGFLGIPGVGVDAVIVDGDKPTNFDLSKPEERPLLAMFLHASGYSEIKVDPTQRIRQDRDLTLRDYRTILGLSRSGSRRDQSRAIANALVRQPQLFPFYRDRDDWAEAIMADLHRKLDVLGVAAE